MKRAPVKLSWQERVKQVSLFHWSRVRDAEAEGKKWGIRDTAKELNRSIGRISEDLQLTSWMKTHPQIEKFKEIEEALQFLRTKKAEIRRRELESL